VVDGVSILKYTIFPLKIVDFPIKNGGFNGSYPLVNVYITMERSTIFNGKIHYFYGHFQ
jgi:hypothetical protein